MKNQLLVFSGSSNPLFGKSVCSHLGIEQGKLDVIKFSDGEISVEIGDNVRGSDVFVIQSTSNPANENLMELLIVIDALKRASAKRITAVLPYFGYARQDRKSRPRVPITAKLVADVITTAGANRVLSMDLHAGQLMGFFNIPVDNLNATPSILPYIKERYQNENIVVVSPDAGGVERARAFANRMGGVDLAVISKHRIGPNKIAEMRVIGDVKDRVCIIVDDMIDTGGTLSKASSLLCENGAKKVLAVAVHGVLSGNAAEVLSESSFEEIIVTDTISVSPDFACKQLKVISVAQVFADAIKNIHNEESLSSLF